MINYLHLRNFKAARDLPLSIGPLTVLAGLNGSGKSTVLQSLALLKQSLDVQILEPNLHLRGSLVQLGRGEDVWSESGGDELSFFIKCSSGEVTLSCRADEEQDVFPLKIESKNFLDIWSEIFSNFQFIEANRLTPATQYNQANGIDRRKGWLGCHGEFAVDYLAKHSNDKVSERRAFPRNALGVPEELYKIVAPTDGLLDQVAGWMQQLSPGVKLTAEDIPLTDDVSLRFQYTGSKIGSEWRPRRPTNVGFGLTYSLPIVVACLAAPSGSLLLLENPEAHLHPQGQAALGYLLANCAADGVQIIVETHSDHLLNGVRLAVKRNPTLSKDVQLHNFNRSIDADECYVESPAILPDGQLNNWPRGFFDQWDRSLDELLD